MQERIASILSAYDNLIENNQKQIKLLEEAAQRLYKEWFVDLHFPGWEKAEIVDGVPKGWRTAKLNEVCSINADSIPSDYEYDYIDYIDIGSVRLGSINEVKRYCIC
jgi:type I restriction enzyme S subunit